jgi:hypothetical protein
MYGLNEIVAMNTFQANCHKERVSSDHLSCYNLFVEIWPLDYLNNATRSITHGEWEARQQKELDVHIDTNNQHEGEWHGIV